MTDVGTNRPGVVRGSVFERAEPGPVAVKIGVSPGELVAVTDDGRRWTVRLANCSIEPGGFDGTHIFVRDPDGAVTISTQDQAIVQALRALGDPRLNELLERVGGHQTHHHRRRRLGITAVTTLGALTLLVIGAAVVLAPKALASSVDALPISIDQQLGDAASAETTSAGPPVTDPVVVGFVQQIVTRLEPYAATPGFTYRVQVVRDEQVNAFALPGGRIVVFTGLIEAADRPAQVAGVLAHEISHVTLRHGVRNVAHRAGLLLAVSILLGDAGGWAELAGDMAVLAEGNSYSRDQEAAADEEGVRMLLAAGIDPRGLSEFFGLLQSQPGGELNGAMNWLSTHPDHTSRIRHVEQLARALPAAPARPLDVDWAAVQRAARAE